MSHFRRKYLLSYSGEVEDDIVWKRASELSNDPHFFLDGATRFDINQVHINRPKRQLTLHQVAISLVKTITIPLFGLLIIQTVYGIISKENFIGVPLI